MKSDNLINKILFKKGKTKMGTRNNIQVSLSISRLLYFRSPVNHV